MNPLGSLTDTGVIFALVDSRGQAIEHQRCRASLRALKRPLVTTWPCFTEAMHLAGREAGWAMQKRLAILVTTGELALHTPTSAESTRMLELMEQYQDRPMDVADASLIALAETQAYQQIFSLDSDFYFYRLADGSILEVSPGPQRVQ